MAPYADCPSSYYLHQALVAKGINIAIGACKLWWKKYRVVSGQVSIASAEDLEHQYGSSIRHLVAEHKTSYRLCSALFKLQPPVYVSDYVAKQWLEKYSGHQTLSIVLNAGRLETEYGERIRAGMPEGTYYY